jgi:hypothetical protein
VSDDERFGNGRRRSEDRFDPQSYELQLLSRLERLSSLAEKRNRDLIPHFLSFAGLDGPIKYLESSSRREYCYSPSLRIRDPCTLPRRCVPSTYPYCRIPIVPYKKKYKSWDRLACPSTTLLLCLHTQNSSILCLRTPDGVKS